MLNSSNSRKSLLTCTTWRCSLWEILWAAGPVYILWFLCLPETSSSSILLYRACRLRKATGNSKFRSQSEIDQKNLTPRVIATSALVKTLRDHDQRSGNPIHKRIYGPRVRSLFLLLRSLLFIYGPIYGFNEGETGLVFLSNLVGCMIGVLIYFAYLYFLLIPGTKKHGMRSPEWRLRPALSCVYLVTLSLFAFGKLSKPLRKHPSPTGLVLTIHDIGWTANPKSTGSSAWSV